MVCDGATETEPLEPVAVKFVPVQIVAFVELHVRVEDCPEVIDVGEAESDTVGALRLVQEGVCPLVQPDPFHKYHTLSVPTTYMCPPPQTSILLAMPPAALAPLRLR